MHEPRRFTVLAAVVALAFLALTATATSAQIYPPAEAFGVTCTDATPGGTTQCSVVGAAPGEVLTVTASADGVVFATFTVTADADGRASFSIDIPADVLGVVLISVSGPESGTATDTITVAEAGAGGTVGPPGGTPLGTPVSASGDALPVTGIQIGALLVSALLLIGGGLVALRRREDGRVAAGA